MAEEGNFKKGSGLIPAAVCPDCGQRMTRREHHSFGQEKYVCENPKCPGKKPREECHGNHVHHKYRVRL